MNISHKTKVVTLKFLSEHPQTDAWQVAGNVGVGIQEAFEILYALHFDGYATVEVNYTTSRFTITGRGEKFMKESKQ